MKLNACSTRAKELVDKYPNHGSQTLAKVIVKEFEGAVSLNQARCAVRRHRGTIGKANRKKRKISKPIKTERSTSMKLPTPKKEFDTWNAVQLRSKKVLVLSDIHVPYFDKPALELAIKKGLDEGVSAVLFNGDLMDFFSISRWLKDPRQRDFPGEIEMGKEILQYFRETFKGCQIWWKMGNHEERWEAFMYQRAPELLGIDDFEIESFMECDRFNVKTVRDMRPIKIGNLNVIHGHEYKFAISNPVNPARGLYLRAKAPAIMGHLHQSSAHTESNINGKICKTWSTGCLCDLHPAYSPLNKWNHGFAIVDLTGDEEFSVKNYDIWNGRIL